MCENLIYCSSKTVEIFIIKQYFFNWRAYCRYIYIHIKVDVALVGGTVSATKCNKNYRLISVILRGVSEKGEKIEVVNILVRIINPLITQHVYLCVSR